MHLASWLSLDGDTVGDGAAPSARPSLRCADEATAATAAAAASTAQVAAAASAIPPAAAGTPIGGVRRLIRNPDELALLDSVTSHAAELDRACDELQTRTRAHWRRQCEQRRRRRIGEIERETGMTFRVEEDGDEGDTAVGADESAAASYVDLFTRLSASLAHLNATALPQLASSVDFNRRLVHELRAEGCDTLAASKERVATAEAQLQARVHALLTGTMRIDEAAVREEFAQQQAAAAASAASAAVASAPAIASAAAPPQSDDALMEQSSLSPVANRAAPRIETTAIGVTVSTSASAEVEVISASLTTPVKFASSSQPSNRTSPATAATAQSSTAGSTVSSSASSQAALVRALLPSEVNAAASRSVPASPRPPLHTQALTGAARMEVDDEPPPSSSSGSHDSSIPLGQPDPPAKTRDVSSPTLSASSPSSAAVSNHSSPARRHVPPTPLAAAAYDGAECTPPLATSQSIAAAAALIETPFMTRIRNAMNDALPPSTAAGASRPLGGMATCACTPQVNGLHVCKFRSPPNRAQATSSSSSNEPTHTSSSSSGASQSGVFLQLHLSQYVNHDGGNNAPHVAVPHGESQHSLSLALSPPLHASQSQDHPVSVVDASAFLEPLPASPLGVLRAPPQLPSSPSEVGGGAARPVAPIDATANEEDAMRDDADDASDEREDHADAVAPLPPRATPPRRLQPSDVPFPLTAPTPAALAPVLNIAEPSPAPALAPAALVPVARSARTGARLPLRSSSHPVRALSVPSSTIASPPNDGWKRKRKFELTSPDREADAARA